MLGYLPLNLLKFIIGDGRDESAPTDGRMNVLISIIGGLQRKDGTIMKASMYFNYTSRSLLRGGQRTMLAVFCVAVGVMAIVALQLVGYMLQSSIASNTRDTNGGDIAVATQSVPFKKSDLSYFTSVKNNG